MLKKDMAGAVGWAALGGALVACVMVCPGPELGAVLLMGSMGALLAATWRYNEACARRGDAARRGGNLGCEGIQR